jgi:cytoskeletal protein RodZ
MTLHNTLVKLRITSLSQRHMLVALIVLPVICLLVFLATLPVAAATFSTVPSTRPNVQHPHKAHYDHARAKQTTAGSSTGRSATTGHTAGSSTSSTTSQPATTSTTSTSSTTATTTNPATTQAGTTSATTANGAAAHSATNTSTGAGGATTSTAGPAMPYTGADPMGHPLP